MAGRVRPLKEAAAVQREQAPGCDEPLPREADPTEVAPGEAASTDEGEAGAPEGPSRQNEQQAASEGWFTALAVGAISPGVNVRSRCHCVPLPACSDVLLVQYPTGTAALCHCLYVELCVPSSIPLQCCIDALPSRLLSFPHNAASVCGTSCTD